MKQTTHKPTAFALIDPIKLALLSVATFGLFELYWFWINWNAVQKAENAKIWPIVRALFAIIFCYPLFVRMTGHIGILNTKHGPAPNTMQWSAGQLTFLYVFLSFLGILPSPYWVLGFASFYPLMEIQKTLNRSYAHVHKLDLDRLKVYSGLEKIIIGAGGLFVTMTVASLFIKG